MIVEHQSIQEQAVEIKTNTILYAEHKERTSGTYIDKPREGYWIRPRSPRGEWERFRRATRGRSRCRRSTPPSFPPSASAESASAGAAPVPLGTTNATTWDLRSEPENHLFYSRRSTIDQEETGNAIKNTKATSKPPKKHQEHRIKRS